MIPDLIEVRSDYTDTGNLTYIDGYTSDDDNGPGFTIAVICECGKVIWFKNEYRFDTIAKEAIEEANQRRGIPYDI